MSNLTSRSDPDMMRLRVDAGVVAEILWYRQAWQLCVG